MSKITVWTKQHENVAEIIEKEGRYTAKRHIIAKTADDHEGLVLKCYDWLVGHLPDKPDDADYPVWVSMEKEATMMLQPGFVMLELEIDEEIITKINIEKWTSITNYSYIPLDEKDKKRHAQMLEEYGTNDIKAFSTAFYPQIKREIEESWQRLFDDDITITGNKNYYGNIWEIRKEWVKKVYR